MLKYATLWDVDGTLADISHRIHFVQNGNKHWKQFFDEMIFDKPNVPVVTLYKFCLNQSFNGVKVEPFIFSARPDSYRRETENFLRENDIYSYTDLLMRKAEDYRKDSIVKQEFLDHIRKLGYTILFSVDDRQSVVDTIRANGITCFQCTPSDEQPDEVVIDRPVLTLMVGPSGAGKSSWLCSKEAENLGIKTTDVVSSDQLREDICGDFQDQSQNNRVFKALHDIVKARVRYGIHTVVDATNLHRKDRMSLLELLPKGSKARYVVIDRPLSEKMKTGGWRLNVNIKGKNLIEFHHQRFQSAKKDILAGDNLPFVSVIDVRNFKKEPAGICEDCGRNLSAPLFDGCMNGNCQHGFEPCY